MTMGPSMLMEGVGEQLVIFLRALLLGVLLGVIYDAVRITRVFAGVDYKDGICVEEPFLRRVFIFFGDVLYCLVAAVLVSLFVYRYNYGIIRFYSFAGFAAGFFAYRVTVGRLVLFAACGAVSGILRIFRAVSRAMHRRFDRYITAEPEKNEEKPKEKEPRKT